MHVLYCGTEAHLLPCTVDGIEGSSPYRVKTGIDSLDSCLGLGTRIVRAVLL